MYFFMFVNLPWALHTERKLLLMEKNAELDQAASKKEHLKTSVEKKQLSQNMKHFVGIKYFKTNLFNCKT